MIKKIIIIAFCILLNSCIFNSEKKINLNLKDMCAYSLNSNLFSVSIIITGDTSIYSSSCTILTNNNTICFKKQLDSLIVNSKKTNIQLYFKSEDNSGIHYYQYDFKKNEIDSLPQNIIIGEINE